MTPFTDLEFKTEVRSDTAMFANQSFLPDKSSKLEAA